MKLNNRVFSTDKGRLYVVLIFAGNNFVHVIFSHGKKKKKMITLFEKIYFGESCEPYIFIFSKIQTMLFS